MAPVLHVPLTRAELMLLVNAARCGATHQNFSPDMLRHLERILERLTRDYIRLVHD